MTVQLSPDPLSFEVVDRLLSALMMRWLATRHREQAIRPRFKDPLGGRSLVCVLVTRLNTREYLWWFE